jgi:gliding motility-associated-like protein
MQKVISFIFIISLSLPSLYGQINLKNGLVACYPFNANAKDESGNGNNGTVNGAALTADRFGKANSAYNFNGSSYISVNPAQFKNQSYSFATWVYLEDTPISENQYSLISVGWLTSDQNLILTTPSPAYARIGNGFSAWGYNNGTPGISNNWTGITPTKAKWYHVVSTRDNTSIKLYVDGILIANNSTTTGTNATTPIYSLNSYGTFGARQNSFISTIYTEFLKGSLDDIHIYSRAITAAEVKALYDGSPAQTITITPKNPFPCGGEKASFTAMGATNTSKYQWKVDGVNQGIDSKDFEYVSVKKTGNYTVKITVDITDDDVCFLQKPTTTDISIVIRDCTPIPTTSTTVNLKDGLIACYPFNANTNDETGNGNDGTVNGATLTTDRFGTASSAYNFNGASTITVAPGKFKNQSYSYATWIKLDELPLLNTGMGFISIGKAGEEQYLNVASYSTYANGFGCGGFNAPANPIFSNNYTNIDPDKNTWYHVVVTRDNVAMRLYVNGVLIINNGLYSATNGSNPSYPADGKFVFGARNFMPPTTPYSSFLKGSLDDIHIYNRAINTNEVKALYEINSTSPTITITASNPTPCGGDKITFTASGAISTSKYQWKVDGVNQGTNSKTFDYTSAKKTGDYTVKITVEVTEEDPCFPQKPVTTDQTFTIKDCIPLVTGVNLKNGLVACYPFNGNSKDESGNNNNGTIKGGVTLTPDRFGKANSAYTFNGIDGFINVPDAPSLKFEQISIAMWIKATQFREFTNSVRSWDRYGGPICRDVRPQGVWSGFTTATSHGLLRFSVAMADKTASQLGVENSVNLDVWDFIVFMIDDGVEKIYRNGVLVLNEPLNKGKKMHPNNEPIFIGRAFWLPSQVQLDAYFTGQIDDIHIYNRPLNEDEIKALYNGISPVPITITASNPTPCGGDKITFTANGAANTSKYQWKVDGVNQGTNSKNFVYNSTNKTADYQVKITVEVTDEDVCFPQKPIVVDKTINIKFCSTTIPTASNKILIPNIFTPNGDGTNDTWEIFNPTSGSDLIIEIYNRWGELVFYSKGYSQPWDGTYKEKPVPEGTYAYIVRIGNDMVLKGAVLVVR